ncbi:MAG: hypothetical protein FWG67_04250 [Defluviitaleaceae bacterium]|nr:hypothetical protein [Defluviitaleaceae bacterium]
MKKLCMLLVLLFLIACQTVEVERVDTFIVGASTIRCIGDAHEMITIEGYDERILSWTVSMTSSRAEFDQAFLQDVAVSDEEIMQLFSPEDQPDIAGVNFEIAVLNADYVVIELIYDYTVIPVEELNRMWDVEDFENTVTLSSVVSNLAADEMACQLVEVEADDELDEPEPEPEEETVVTEPEVVAPTRGIINDEMVLFVHHPDRIDAYNAILLLHTGDEVTLVELDYNAYWSQIEFVTDLITGFPYTFTGFVLRAAIDVQ